MPSLLFIFAVASTALVAGPSRRVDADEVDTLRDAALAALERGAAPEAVALTGRALAQAPERASVWVVAGYARSRAGDGAGALQAYREAVQRAPDDPVAHNNLGALLIAQGQVEAGLTEIEAALGIEPAYADARNNQAAAFERLGRVQEARQLYEEVAQSGRGHATALTNLGTLRWRAGERGAALADWRRAQRLDPQLVEAGLNLLLTSEGSPDEAMARLEAQAARPGAPASVRVQALRARAALRARDRRWDEALALLEQAQRLAPWDARVLNDLAVAEDQLGRDREALSHLAAALDLEPGLTVARNNLGIVQVHAGATDAAIETFQAVLARDPRFHRAHYNLGVLQASQGRLAEAQQSFRAAAGLAPRDAAVRYNLGLVSRQGGGDVAGERRSYEEALALDPTLAEAHLALGMLLADPATPSALRDESRAASHLQRFLELAAPSDGEGRLQARTWLQWLAER